MEMGGGRPLITPTTSAPSQRAGKPYYVETFEELRAAMPGAVAHVGPAIMHIRIDRRASRKKQQFPFGSMQSMLAGSAAKPKSKL